MLHNIYMQPNSLVSAFPSLPCANSSHRCWPNRGHGQRLRSLPDHSHLSAATESHSLLQTSIVTVAANPSPTPLCHGILAPLPREAVLKSTVADEFKVIATHSQGEGNCHREVGVVCFGTGPSGHGQHRSIRFPATTAHG